MGNLLYLHTLSLGKSDVIYGDLKVFPGLGQNTICLKFWKRKKWEIEVKRGEEKVCYCNNDGNKKNHPELGFWPGNPLIQNVQMFLYSSVLSLLSFSNVM